MSFTIGSLFDGSGGFPLAASLCGGTPKWASEVEPYPIAVTKSRFPDMKHLGSVTDLHGGEVEPVDVISFGSPCQDMSVAGKRAGLKHEAKGDEETTRSGLFMEAVRIIKEMREATNGAYPRFALWENVPGAFSSNKGEDFRIVLEELIKIVEPSAVMPEVPKNGWPYADSYCGDGWSLAYRLLDAQYWGVPQRRRRIYLVLDLRGQCAGKVLFEREGLRGYFAEGRTPWQGTASDAQRSVDAANREGNCVAYVNDPCVMEAAGFCTEHSANARGVGFQEEVAPTLRAGVVPASVYSIENHPADSRVNIDESGKVQTLTSRMGTGGGNVPMVLEGHPVYCLQGNGIDRADTAGCNGKGVKEDTAYTLNTIDRHAVAYPQQAYDKFIKDEIGTTLKACGGSYGGGSETLICEHDSVRYIVRRLTPTECARLQGFPDKWGHPNWISEDTKGEVAEFWREVYLLDCAIKEKKPKPRIAEKQEGWEVAIIRWYNGLHTDSSEYKMWGNGIALPNALYVMQGIVDALDKEEIEGKMMIVENTQTVKLITSCEDASVTYLEFPDGLRLIFQEGEYVGWYVSDYEGGGKDAE